MRNATGLARRTRFAAALAVLWLAWPLLAAAQHDHADNNEHVEHSMLDDPLNKLVLLDRFETQHTDGGTL